jgi:hypothetical protein
MNFGNESLSSPRKEFARLFIHSPPSPQEWIFRTTFVFKFSIFILYQVPPPACPSNLFIELVTRHFTKVNPSLWEWSIPYNYPHFYLIYFQCPDLSRIILILIYLGGSHSRAILVATHLHYAESRRVFQAGLTLFLSGSGLNKVFISISPTCVEHYSLEDEDCKASTSLKPR